MSTTRVKSFEEACKAQGVDPNTVLPDVSCLPESDRKAVIALAKMCIIQRSLNGDWKPDWNNYDQNKYFPWFDVEVKEDSSSGFGLSCSAFDCDDAVAFLGVRLYYPDRDTARYAGETFIELYEDLILQPK